MNRPRTYAKNKTGISISEGFGQINISNLCMEVLGNPYSITFLPRDGNDDWLYLVPNCQEPPEDSITARVKYRDRHNMKRPYIASHEVVSKICDDYYIYRKNPCIYAPFYILRAAEYNGKRCVRICMDNFEQHKDE